MIDKEARELGRRGQKEGADRGTSMTSKTVAMLLAGAQATLNRALAEQPERFTRRPRPPQINTEVWINEPLKETPASPPITETVEKPSVSLDLTNSEPRALLSCREPCPWQRHGLEE